MKIFKNTSQETVPPHAKIITKKGQQFAKYEQRGGGMVEFPILANGKMKAESLAWYARILHHGDRIRKPVNLRLTDRTAAMTKALELQDDEERRAIGRITRAEIKKSEKPLIGNPGELPERKAVKRAEQTKADLRAAIAGSWLGEFLDSQEILVNTFDSIRLIRCACIYCGFEKAADMTSPVLTAYLLNYVSKTTGRKLSPASKVKHILLMRQFGEFIRQGMGSKDYYPFADVKEVKTGGKTGPNERRNYEDAELLGLIKSAQESDKIVEKIDGRQRAVLYQFAAATGIRALELSQLWPADIRFGAKSFVDLDCTITKNGRSAKQPLLPKILLGSDIVEVMRQWVAGRGPSEPLFDVLTGSDNKRKFSKLIEVDCENAEPPIIRETKAGTADFHSLRNWFDNRLRALGVDLEIRSKLMRHSDVRTTAGYGRVKAEECYDTVNEALSQLSLVG